MTFEAPRSSGSEYEDHATFVETAQAWMLMAALSQAVITVQPQLFSGPEVEIQPRFLTRETGQTDAASYVDKAEQEQAQEPDGRLHRRISQAPQPARTSLQNWIRAGTGGGKELLTAFLHFLLRAPSALLTVMEDPGLGPKGDPRGSLPPPQVLEPRKP